VADALSSALAAGSGPLGPLGLAPAPASGQPREGGGPSFEAALALERAGITFSKHAQRRIDQRGIEFDVALAGRLERAVERAEAKGSRDSLVLLDELALVVSVQHRTVITAVDEQSRKEHVFTNIDSVVIADA